MAMTWIQKNQQILDFADYEYFETDEKNWKNLILFPLWKTRSTTLFILIKTSTWNIFTTNAWYHVKWSAL